MNNNLVSLNERTEELLSLLVTEGLSADEQREFDQIDWSDLGTSVDAEIARFEQAAAGFAIAFEETGGGADESLPADLRDRLASEAQAFFASAGHSRVERTIQPATLPTSAVAPPSWREALAILAAAACIAMLLFNWYLTAGELSIDKRMARLIRANPADLVTVDWTQVQDENARGQVVWSDARQEGYMVFDGLPVNDPTKEQYQLWIFDTDRTQKFPVDGGVFDIRSDGKVTVAIDPGIPVKKAVMFAVTIEDPGGVVVSTRERLPVLAEVD